ncbi:MAG: hypothetical protein ACYDEE_08360 [Ignavibacteriaceae bacterium]
MKKIEESSHVKPIIYIDKELKFLTAKKIPGINYYRNNLAKQFGKKEPNVMLHDSVFVKIDQTAKLFRVNVLKTNETIPYSSVFIQLDCKYWDSLKEKQLRKRMKTEMIN